MQVEEGNDPGRRLIAGPAGDRFPHHLLCVVPLIVLGVAALRDDSLSVWLYLITQEILVGIDLNVERRLNLLLLMLLAQVIVRLNSLLLIVVSRQGYLRRIRAIRYLLHAQRVRCGASFQVRGPVLARRRALHPLLTSLPVRSNWDLLLLMRMHRSREGLVVLLLVVMRVARLDGRLAVHLRFVVAASGGGCSVLGYGRREVNAFILDHSQELDGLVLRHVLHVRVQLVHKLGRLVLVERLVTLRCNCNHAILPNLYLGLVALQQPTLITLALLQVLDARVDVLLIDQLLVRLHEIFLDDLCPRLVAEVAAGRLSQVPVLVRVLRDLEVLDEPESISCQVGGRVAARYTDGGLHILLAKVVRRQVARMHLTRMLAKMRCHELHGVGLRVRLGELANELPFRVRTQLLNVIKLTLHQLRVVLLLVGLRVQSLLGHVKLVRIMEPTLIARMHRAIVLALVDHDDTVRLVLLRHLPDLQIVFRDLRVSLLAGAAVLRSRGHYLQVLLVIHRRVQVRGAGASGCPAKDLHVLHTASKLLQFATAVDVVAAVHGVVRAHPLNDEAVFDHLVHVWLLAVQTLLDLVIRLLHQPGMLIEIDPCQVIMRLLRECSLLRGRLDHPPIILAVLEHVVLLLVLDVRRRLLH